MPWLTNTEVKVEVKLKAIPLQGCTVPCGSSRLSLAQFLDSHHMNVVRFFPLYAPAAFTPQEIFLVSQMKHQLDATMCRFYFCRVTLHVSGASAHHQEYLKLVQRPLVHVLSLQVSHHISLLGPELPALIS